MSRSLFTVFHPHYLAITWVKFQQLNIRPDLELVSVPLYSDAILLTLYLLHDFGIICKHVQVGVQSFLQGIYTDEGKQ